MVSLLIFVWGFHQVHSQCCTSVNTYGTISCVDGLASFTANPRYDYYRVHFSTDQTEDVTISTCGSGYDTVTTVYSTPTPSVPTWLAVPAPTCSDGDDCVCSNNEEYTLSNLAAGDYVVRVDAYPTSVCSCSPPTSSPLKVSITGCETPNPTPAPTEQPTPSPTEQPTPAPTEQPTPAPTDQPTPGPTKQPTPAPTEQPTPAPTDQPTPAPTKQPTPAPTEQPTPSPTEQPTPTPTKQPTPSPTKQPTPSPTKQPTRAPTDQPTATPSQPPSAAPSTIPSIAPSAIPSQSPSDAPSITPTPAPTDNPTKNPTTPSPTPPGTLTCGEIHTGDYNGIPLQFIVNIPFEGDLEFDATNSVVTIFAIDAYDMLNNHLEDDSDGNKIVTLTNIAAGNYKFNLTGIEASSMYDVRITCTSDAPTAAPSIAPSSAPTDTPSRTPTQPPSTAPSRSPTYTPSKAPSVAPSTAPTQPPSDTPSYSPSDAPSAVPSVAPSQTPSNAPTPAPTDNPTKNPTTPSPTPPGTLTCGEIHTGDYNGMEINFTVNIPYEGDVTFDATNSIVAINAVDAYDMMGNPLANDTDGNNIVTLSNVAPGNYRFILDGGIVSSTYDIRITCSSDDPTTAPSRSPSDAPTKDPTSAPTSPPTSSPSTVPSGCPTFNPLPAPTDDPTSAPTDAPSFAPTESPTKDPTENPTKDPTTDPTIEPTINPTKDPSITPTKGPTINPTKDPTTNPTIEPTIHPTKNPTKYPTKSPTNNPTQTDAVTTNYEVKIDINCESTDDDGTDNTECDIDPDVLNEVIETTLITEGTNVEIISTQIVNDDLVIHLSIITGPENILKPDIITDHIEKEIKDNDDFGNVETEEKDDEFNDIMEEDGHSIVDHARRILNDPAIMIAILSVSICGMCCMAIVGYCYGQNRMQKRLIQRQAAELVRMTSFSSVSPMSPMSSDMGSTDDGVTNACGEGKDEPGDTRASGDTSTPGDATNAPVMITPGDEKIETPMETNAPVLVTPGDTTFNFVPANNAVQSPTLLVPLFGVPVNNVYSHSGRERKSTMDNLGELKDLPDENDQNHGDVALDLLANSGKQQRKDESKNEDESSGDNDDDDLMYDNVNNGKKANYVLQTAGGPVPGVSSAQDSVALQEPSSPRDELLNYAQMMGGVGGFGGFGAFEPIFETPGDIENSKGDNKDIDDKDDKNKKDNRGGFGGF